MSDCDENLDVQKQELNPKLDYQKCSPFSFKKSIPKEYRE